jgi:hypothetical protein
MRMSDYSTMAMDILLNKWHLPLKNGKVNRENIEDRMVIGIYNKDLEPMLQEEADLIIDLVDELVAESGEKKVS